MYILSKTFANFKLASHGFAYSKKLSSLFKFCLKVHREICLIGFTSLGHFIVSCQWSAAPPTPPPLKKKKDKNVPVISDPPTRRFILLKRRVKPSNKHSTEKCDSTPPSQVTDAPLNQGTLVLRWRQILGQDCRVALIFWAVVVLPVDLVWVVWCR